MGEESKSIARLMLVRDFVNTCHGDKWQDHLATVLQTQHWLESYDLLPRQTPITEGDRRRLLDTREMLRALLRANNGDILQPAILDRLNQLATYAPLTVQFIYPSDTLLKPESTGVDGSIAHLLAITYAAQCDASWSRLKACRNDACQRAFYDTSKNHSGLWCDMRLCGNRMKAANYRQRHDMLKS